MDIVKGELMSVFSEGVIAYTNQYVIDPDKSDIFYVSLIGTRQSVEKITLEIVVQKQVKVQITGNPPARLDYNIRDEQNYVSVLKKSGSSSTYRIRPIQSKSQLTKGRVHGYYVDTLCEIKKCGHEFVIIGRNTAEAANKFNSVLHSKAVPYLPAWQQWFMNKLEQEKLINPLLCCNCVAYLVTYNEDAYKKIIIDGIKNKEIKF